MKKTGGILLNVFIKVAKAVPFALLAAAVFAMAAYVVCVNALPISYCAEAEFAISLPEADAKDLLRTEGFYSRVADAYSASEGTLSPETAKKLFTISENEDGSFALSVRTTSPEVSYDLMNTVLIAVECVAVENLGTFETLSVGSIPTSMTRPDIRGYIALSAMVGAAVVILLALRRGLAFSSIESEKEFARILNMKILGTLPYSAHPLTRHKPSKARSE